MIKAHVRQLTAGAPVTAPRSGVTNLNLSRSGRNDLQVWISAAAFALQMDSVGMEEIKLKYLADNLRIKSLSDTPQTRSINDDLIE